ncbi:MAG TPA: hypothetical protein VHQ90_17055 [Thermoanaerobaculia bacterium]|nr:hypothetical protein [Thermoanaerobaculia bacterium]
MPVRSRKTKTPIERLRILLSSRNRDLIPDGAGGTVALSEVRRKLQDDLQRAKFLGYQLLEVWINEEAGAESGDADIWGHCMREVDRADIVVVIYNGEAGWGADLGEVGICHAEMQRVFDRSPSKLRPIALDFASNPALGLISPKDAAARNSPNRRFAEDVAPLMAAVVKDRRELEDRVQLAVVQAVAELARTGSEEGRKGQNYLGPPLSWSRLTYIERKHEMESVVRTYLVEVRKARGEAADAEPLQLVLDEQPVVVSVHAVPAGFAIAEARELVGRPYLRDHKIPLAGDAGGAGPVHLIACHKSCTESQVNSFMGHPDVFTVQGPFGFFVADLVSFVQTFFLTGCRDATATRVAVRRMFDWIGQSGELPRIVTRALSRKAILEAVAQEIRKGKGHP